ncbi:hypothetical protein C0989_008010 [Termitomyces sp. Mn162]|nr:hypothetical protein C0989_008010 [Termitomyces sp. Mn162]
MDGNFDVVIIGTGLAESIAAAALSKTGFKVAHIDENSYYGGNEASISLDELVQWVDTVASSQNPKYTSVSRSARIPSQTRQYSICLSPSIITSIGPVISSLISSGVAKYGGFRLLERVGVYKSGTIKGVPGSKEDVFKDKHISLIDKRRLMRFLKFAAGEFENEKELEGTDNMSFADLLSNNLLYRFCIAYGDIFVQLADTVHHHFLLGTMEVLERLRKGFAVLLLSLEESIFLGGLLGDSNPSSFSVVRGIVIIDQGIIFPPTNTPPPAEDVDEASASPDSAASPKAPAPLDAGVIVFPPSSVTGGSTTTAATILVTGEGTMSTPRGKCPFFFTSLIQILVDRISGILYITLPLSTPPLESTSAEEILRPYLTATLSLQTESTPSTSAVQLNSPPSSSDRAPSSPSEDVSPRPLFTVFYIEHPDPASSLPVPENSSAHPHTYIVPTPLIPACPLPDLPNSAATSAEDVFWETVRKLQEAGVRPQRNQASDEEHLAEEYDEIESFWPPMQADEESGGED